MSPTLIFFIAGAVLLVAIYFLVDYFQKKRLERAGTDARASIRPNDTNYNLDTLPDETIEKATKAEAKQIIENVRKSDAQTSLSRDDFYRLKEKVAE